MRAMRALARRPGGRGSHSQWPLVAPLVAAVIAADQLAKWWAVRHVDRTLINPGGFVLLRRSVRGWFAAPMTGAVADAVGVLLVVGGVALLFRRRRRPVVLLGGGLVAAGWASNLLDRLRLHEWTAPGSERGVVDFIPSGSSSRCNLADLAIVLGGGLLLWATASRLRSTERRRPPTRSARQADRELDVALGVDAGVEQLVVE